jgi:alkaline phosphatase D
MMPPIISAPPPAQSSGPRIILYQQTHHQHEKPVSLIPLLTAEQPPSITHLILAAIHINISPPALALNDHHPDHPRFTQLWDEVLALQDSGIKVMGMLGGAAQGSFARLDYDPSELASLPSVLPSGTTARLSSPKNFAKYYSPLRDFIRTHDLQGIDLDVEEETSLPGMIHLIDRLRADFGAAFIITLAPVVTALVRGMKHLSGFDYFELDHLRGKEINWYNVQFYNGWGHLEQAYPTATGRAIGWYDQVVGREGWTPERLVVGLLTNPRHGGSGYVGWDVIARKLGELLDRYPGFGGVMGWEYWGAVPELEGVALKEGEGEVDGEGELDSHYWTWSWRMRRVFAMKELRDCAVAVAAGRSMAGLRVSSRVES